ncbi:MAG: membrane protein insertion efficiency factor YidD [Deltaproteobacteria bacterium]|nr:membrane protein insertion efficiency factor YidD [Deltaproteobacteria bacterium]
MKLFFLFIIRVYRFCVSPFFGKKCRFFPSCSEYSEQCFKEFHFIKAFCLSIKRILKCHPLHKGGIDLVPRKS